jgi:DUF4097 and DUF4098 domain-containing protein YvlB
MKKSIVALMAIAFVALSLSGCSGEVKYETHVYQDLGAVRHIVIDDTNSYLQVLPSTDGKLSVECQDIGDIRHYVAVENSTLIVRYNPKWYNYLFDGIGFGNVEPFVRIYLPEGEYGCLDLEITSGDVEISEGYTFETVDLECTSGRIKLGADVNYNLDAECTSGEVTLSGVACGSVSLEVTSGTASIVDSVVLGGMDLECTSGKIRCFNVNAENVFVEMTSGDLEAKNLIATGKLWFDFTSGDAHLEACDASEMNIQLTSGSVKGTILTPKSVNGLSVTSGSAQIPSATENNGTCSVKITSGSVSLSLAK